MRNYKLVSYKTKKEVNEKDSVTTDDLGGPLEVVYDYKRLKSRFNSYLFETAPISSLKYLNLYPIDDLNNIVSLDEGGTPLYKSTNLITELNTDYLRNNKKLKSKIINNKHSSDNNFFIKNLYFKYEGSNPTGSFKDRGTLIEVAKAIELNAKAITLASTGNMAASVAAYAKKANIPCYVFVPEGTPSSKLAQSLSFGAHVIQVRGSYVDAAKLAEQVAKKYKFYLAGDYCFRQEGQKSIAYEIIEQLRWQVPDYVFVPVGVGTNISAVWKGFKEYKELGLIDKLPRIVAVQAEGASPIIKTFNLDLKDFYVFDKVNTVSSAIAVGNPLDGVKVIDILKESKGFAAAVSDNETLESQLELANKESIFVEPSSATVIAALKKLVADKKLQNNCTVVCVLTGNGLKDPEKAIKLLSLPPLIDLTIEDFDNYLKIGTSTLSIKAEDTEKVLFSEFPTQVKIKKVIKENFNTDTGTSLAEIKVEIDSFLKKGKKVTKSDLKYILDITSQTVKKKNLNVEAFEINVKKDLPPTAILNVNIEGKIYKAESIGTGPVDAAVNAILLALKQAGKSKITLVDYKVAINSSGTDSVVEVSIKVTNGLGKFVIGLGTSPDIIQASIDAFVNSYNALQLDI